MLIKSNLSSKKEKIAPSSAKFSHQTHRTQNRHDTSHKSPFYWVNLLAKLIFIFKSFNLVKLSECLKKTFCLVFIMSQK